MLILIVADCIPVKLGMRKRTGSFRRPVICLQVTLQRKTTMAEY